MSVCILGIDGDGALEGAHRRLTRAKTPPHETQTVMVIRNSGIQQQRPFNQRRCQTVFAPLMQGKAQQMTGIGMVGIVGQHAPVSGSRFLQPPGAVFR